MSSAVWEFKDRCAVSGIGNTKFSRNSGVSELVMAVEASRAAIRDAGLQSNDIDGIVRNDADRVTHNAIADSLGISDLKYWGVASAGGSAVPSMVGQAVGALLSGQATNVLVYRSLNGRSGTRFGLSRAAAGSGDAPTVVGGQGTLDEYFQPYGLLSAGTFYAMLAQRHMAEFGTTSEQLGAIAMECRIRAHANPNAMMAGRELSLSDYMAGRMLSSPLRLFDYCLETDGACALVVTTTERAADSPAGPVLIRAVAQGMGPGIQAGRMNTTLMRETYTTWPSAYAAKTLYECFTITVLIQLEDYGFCKKGEGGPFAESGALGLGGSLPINTGGGHLSEGYIHGLNHVVEGVRQIRGSSTSQVPNAEVCLVTGASPP